jgi:hypothetical protein
LVAPEHGEPPFASNPRGATLASRKLRNRRSRALRAGCSDYRRRSRETRVPTRSRERRDTALTTRGLGLGDLDRRRRLGGLCQERRDVLAKCAVGRVNGRAVLSGLRLDVRVRASAHGVALELRVRHHHEWWEDDLQERGESPEEARQAGRSPHGENDIGSPGRTPPDEQGHSRYSVTRARRSGAGPTCGGQ